MRINSQQEREPTVPPSFIVEVEGYDGEDGRIVVENDRAGLMGLGVPDKLYCIAQMGDDGVVRFNDWGYATPEEAITALSGRRRWSLAKNSNPTPPRP